jgi:hypothetical protein
MFHGERSMTALPLLDEAAAKLRPELAAVPEVGEAASRLTDIAAFVFTGTVPKIPHDLQDALARSDASEVGPVVEVARRKLVHARARFLAARSAADLTAAVAFLGRVMDWIGTREPRFSAIGNMAFVYFTTAAWEVARDVDKAPLGASVLDLFKYFSRACRRAAELQAVEEAEAAEERHEAFVRSLVNARIQIAEAVERIRAAAHGAE